MASSSTRRLFMSKKDYKLKDSKILNKNRKDVKDQVAIKATQQANTCTMASNKKVKSK